LNGQISRNEALRNFVSRLGALINKINKEPDWEIQGYYKERDYIYKLLKAPVVNKVQIINGRAVLVNQGKLL
jgi:hypothetical protein